MKDLSFDTIYKKLQKRESKKLTKKEIKEEKLIEALLNEKADYLQTKVDKETILRNNEVKIEQKQYGNITYGVYMHKNEIKDFTLDPQYNMIELPDKVYYSTSMVIIKETEKGTSTIDNILAIRSKDKNIVQKRYSYIVNILNTYSESQILELVNSEIDEQI